MNNRPADIVAIVAAHFGSDAAADAWFVEPNPQLGGVSPDHMIAMGRVDKLRRFVQQAMEANDGAD